MRHSSVALLLGLLLAGCSHTKPSVKTAAFEPRPGKVFFWSSLEHVKTGARFDAPLPQGFNRRFAEDLEACGAKVTVFSETGLELNGKAFDAAVEASGADTVVTLRKNRGQLDKAERLNWAYYDLEFFVSGEPGTPVLQAAAKGKKPVSAWKGEIMLTIVYPWTGFTGTPYDVQGARQADMVTNQLKAEGFYPGCAPIPVTTIGSASSAD